jgi:hypothetical protein
MQRLEVSGAVRRIYIYVVRRLRVKNSLPVHSAEFLSLLRELYINISLLLEAVSARKRRYLSAVTPTEEHQKQRTSHLTCFSFL